MTKVHGSSLAMKVNERLPGASPYTSQFISGVRILGHFLFYPLINQSFTP